MDDLKIKNIAFYAFFKPAFKLGVTQDLLHDRMLELNIKGTILLAQEGINCSLSGTTKKMDEFLQFLSGTIGIKMTNLKISYSEENPFKRTLVKVKPSIVVNPGNTPIDPIQDKAPYISPEDLHQWIKENKKMMILDTRNAFEYQAGRFKDSLHLGTKHFADFEGDLQNVPQEWQRAPIVTICTGGIRCEKAAPLMIKKGFQKVYQLDGGILNYFKKVGRGYFEGGCFVFDERIALNETLKPLLLKTFFFLFLLNITPVWAQTAEQFVHLGNVAGRQEQYPQAIIQYTKAIGSKPDYANAYYNRGYVYVKLRKYKLAIADLDKAIEIDPHYAAAYHVRGIAYYRKKKFAQSIADYSNAIELEPDNLRYYESRLSSYFRMGNNDKAWKDVIKIQELGGTVNPTIMNLLKNKKYRDQ